MLTIHDFIHGEEIEIVNEYKYLGTVIGSKLRFNKNAFAIAFSAAFIVPLLGAF